jgi:hypothetical protein
MDGWTGAGGRQFPPSLEDSGKLRRGKRATFVVAPSLEGSGELRRGKRVTLLVE